MTDFDVIIIGAGAAGLAAGRTLLEKGVSFRVFEAKDRVGGRAWTDTHCFGGIPFDRGCHWMHSASQNPFPPIADAFGFAYEKRGSRRSRHLFLAGERTADSVKDEAWDTIEAAFEAACVEGRQGRDIAAGDVVDETGRWYPLVDHWYRLLSGVPPRDVSTLDLSKYTDTGENWPVADGYGALIAAHGASVPVELSTPVGAIDWSGGDVAVDTPRGKARARAAIVTVSTAVLANGGMTVTPNWPADIETAIDACPLGFAEKVGFLLSASIPGFSAGSYVDTFDPRSNERKPINFTVHPGSHPYIVGQLGGPHARDLEAAGEAAMVDFARAGFLDAFGSDAEKLIQRITTTHWSSDENILGGYSCARPGQGDRRRLFSHSVGDRIFFAGEAVSINAFSTAHGAHLTGIEAANAALATLSPSKES